MPAHSDEIKTKGATFIRFYPSDWRSGCIGLTLEQEGLYWRICAHHYETGGRLPIDDADAAHRLGLNPKNYRRVRDQLLALGKIQTHEDGYTNDRAERELAIAIGAKHRVELRPADVAPARDVADPQREDRRSEVSRRRISGKDSTKTADQSGIDRRSIGDQSAIICDKIEENQYASIELRTKNQELTNRASAGEPVCSPSAELRQAFNGSTENLLDDIQRWMGPLADRGNAVRWLTTTLSASNSDAVLAAYQQLLASQAKGRLIADPLRYLGKTAATLKGKPAASAAADVLPFKVTTLMHAKPAAEKIDPRWQVNHA